jgi:hypothetical protein
MSACVIRKLGEARQRKSAEDHGQQAQKNAWHSIISVLQWSFLFIEAAGNAGMTPGHLLTHHKLSIGKRR